MTKNQHTYDDEFRWNAVDLYVNSSKSMTEIASELGISTETLRGWKRKILGGTDAGDLVEENRRLRREVEHLRRQRDILKKAAAILGEDPHAGRR